MTPADFAKLWTTIQQRPQLLRPWPSDVAARTLQTQIGDPPRGSEVTTSRMSHFKTVAAIGQRPNFPDQKAVMNASATDVRSYPTHVYEMLTINEARKSDVGCRERLNWISCRCRGTRNIVVFFKSLDC